MGEIAIYWDSVIRTMSQTDFQGLANAIGELATDPIVRAVMLVALIFPTIWLIAIVYSASASSSQYGPVGLRPHVARRLSRGDLLVHKDMLPMSIDGLHITRCDVYYSYVDRKGDRKEWLVHSMKDLKLNVSPSKIPHRVRDIIYGQEIPSVPTADVCFPPFELSSTPEQISPTPELAPDYAAMHDILKAWQEDDDAFVVTMSEETIKEIKSSREDLIVSAAAQARRARERPLTTRLFGRQIAKMFSDQRGAQQPNVVGNYFLRFKFRKDPMFVLSKHPDRDLKMTAWLTLLTSLFAIGMDLWPKRDPGTSRPAPGGWEQPTRIPLP